MRALVILTLLGGCLYEDNGECYDHYEFDGPWLMNPYVVPVEDRFFVGWQSLPPEASTTTHHLAIVDGAGQVVPGSEIEYGTERVKLLAAPAGRELYLRGEIELTYQLRLPTGELVGAPLRPGDIGELGVFDGDAFLFLREGIARRLGLDGTVGAPFLIPQPTMPMYLHRVVATEGVTWLVYTRDDAVEVLRIRRGGGALDPAPRRVSDQGYHHDVAAGPRELAIITGSRQDTMAWHVLREDGTLTTKPLELPDRPGVHPWFGMTAEPSAYLAIFEGGSLAARVTSDGAPSQPFAWPVMFTNAPDYGRGPNLSMFVYSSRVPDATAPEIRAMPIPFGGEPGAAMLVKTVEGETRFVDCGCRASRGAGGALVIVVLGVVRRRRRRRAAAAP